MTELMAVPAWALAAGVVCLVALAVGIFTLVLSTRAARRRADHAAAELAELRERTEKLSDRVEALGPTRSSITDTSPGFVITSIDDPTDPDDSDDVSASDALIEQRIEGGLFADLVLRESAVRAATLAAGLRRALAPETRNRIRFAMRQDIKRSRKNRRRELRTARREYEARQGDAA